MLIEHCLENKINNPCRNMLSTKVMLITKNVLIRLLSYYGKESILINNESLLKLPLDFFSYKYFCSFAYLLMTMKMIFN